MTTWLRPVPPGRPFHQLARNDVYRWWRPLVAVLFIAVFSLGAMLALALVMLLAVWAVTGHWLEFAGSGDELFTNDLANLFALIASVAILLPVVLVATLLIDRRHLSWGACDGGGWRCACCRRSVTCSRRSGSRCFSSS
jgi:hypothetical protein